MSHVLMLCHDQHLDRRIIAEATSLITIGHRVTLLALSHGPEQEVSTTPEGINLIRIALRDIVPANPTYRGYITRQHHFNNLLNRLCRTIRSGRRVWNAAFRIASRMNWHMYRLLLFARYRNRRLSDPLPFTSAFVKAGRNFRADIVQVHDLPTLEAGTVLAAQWKVPLVYDAHELYPEQCSFSAVQRKICADAERGLIKSAQLVFAVNESIAHEMATRYAIQQPVTLLNAIDPPQGFDPQAGHDLLRQKLSLAPERRILLFQGGFAPNRNLDMLVVAMALVKSSDVDLVMMGFGVFGDKLKAESERLQLLGRRVYFLPAVPQSELLQHSASADVGIIPYPHVDLNSYYCTPNKLFEYIQAALPILANDSPELRRFVEAPRFGLVKPMHTTQQIATAIDEVFISPALDEWRANLMARRADFSWRVQSDVYLRAMRVLCAEAVTCEAAE